MEPNDSSPTPSEKESSPAEVPNQLEPEFGWTAYAEQINGRFAMVGFLGLLLLELFTHQNFFTWIGFF